MTTRTQHDLVITKKKQNKLLLKRQPPCSVIGKNDDDLYDMFLSFNNCYHSSSH